MHECQETSGFDEKDDESERATGERKAETKSGRRKFLEAKLFGGPLLIPTLCVTRATR